MQNEITATGSTNTATSSTPGLMTSTDLSNFRMDYVGGSGQGQITESPMAPPTPKPMSMLQLRPPAEQNARLKSGLPHVASQDVRSPIRLTGNQPPRSGHSRHRDSPTQGSADTATGSSMSSTRSDASRRRGHRSPTQKTMLSKALAKANTAVLLDNAQNFHGAVDAYAEACELLHQVMLRSSDADDRNKLSAIHTTYSNRVAELREMDEPFTTYVTDKELPEPPSDPSNNYYEDDELGIAPVIEPRRVEEAHIPPRTQSLMPTAFMSGSQSADAMQTQDPRVAATEVQMRRNPPLVTGLTVPIPMDEDYMPPPLSPRKPPSPREEEVAHPPVEQYLQLDEKDIDPSPVTAVQHTHSDLADNMIIQIPSTANPGQSSINEVDNIEWGQSDNEEDEEEVDEANTAALSEDLPTAEGVSDIVVPDPGAVHDNIHQACPRIPDFYAAAEDGSNLSDSDWEPDYDEIDQISPKVEQPCASMPGTWTATEDTSDMSGSTSDLSNDEDIFSPCASSESTDSPPVQLDCATTKSTLPPLDFNRGTIESPWPEPKHIRANRKIPWSQVKLNLAIRKSQLPVSDEGLLSTPTPSPQSHDELSSPATPSPPAHEDLPRPDTPCPSDVDAIKSRYARRAPIAPVASRARPIEWFLHHVHHPSNTINRMQARIIADVLQFKVTAVELGVPLEVSQLEKTKVEDDAAPAVIATDETTIDQVGVKDLAAIEVAAVEVAAVDVAVEEILGAEVVVAEGFAEEVTNEDVAIDEVVTPQVSQTYETTVEEEIVPAVFTLPETAAKEVVVTPPPSIDAQAAVIKRPLKSTLKVRAFCEDDDEEESSKRKKVNFTIDIAPSRAAVPHKRKVAVAAVKPDRVPAPAPVTPAVEMNRTTVNPLAGLSDFIPSADFEDDMEYMHTPAVAVQPDTDVQLAEEEISEPMMVDAVQSAVDEPEPMQADGVHPAVNAPDVMVIDAVNPAVEGPDAMAVDAVHPTVDYSALLHPVQSSTNSREVVMQDALDSAAGAATPRVPNANFHIPRVAEEEDSDEEGELEINVVMRGTQEADPTLHLTRVNLESDRQDYVEDMQTDQEREAKAEVDQRKILENMGLKFQGGDDRVQVLIDKFTQIGLTEESTLSLSTTPVSTKAAAISFPTSLKFHPMAIATEERTIVNDLAAIKNQKLTCEAPGKAGILLAKGLRNEPEVDYYSPPLLQHTKRELSEEERRGRGRDIGTRLSHFGDAFLTGMACTETEQMSKLSKMLDELDSYENLEEKIIKDADLVEEKGGISIAFVLNQLIQVLENQPLDADLKFRERSMAIMAR